MQNQIASYSDMWYSYALLLWGPACDSHPNGANPFWDWPIHQPSAVGHHSPNWRAASQSFDAKAYKPLEAGGKASYKAARKASASQLQEQDCRRDLDTRTYGQTNLASTRHATIAHFKRPLLHTSNSWPTGQDNDGVSLNTSLAWRPLQPISAPKNTIHGNSGTTRKPQTRLIFYRPDHLLVFDALVSVSRG